MEYSYGQDELGAVLTKDRRTSVAGFAERRDEVDKALPYTDLDHCDSFNHMYRTLSWKVDDRQQQLSGKGSFKEKETLQMISPTFGDLYLDPLQAVVEGREPPAPWRHL